MAGKSDACLAPGRRGCSALEKLSMAHNELSDLGDALAGLPQLQVPPRRLDAMSCTALPADEAGHRSHVGLWMHW